MGKTTYACHARRERAGEWQIGIFTVTRKGKYWEAFAVGALGEYTERFKSFSEAYKALTGEPIRI